MMRTAIPRSGGSLPDLPPAESGRGPDLRPETAP